MRVTKLTSPRKRINLPRRLVGLLVCLSPIVLLTASLFVAMERQTQRSSGLFFAIPGLLVGILNVYLSFVRPWIFHRRRMSPKEYRHVSGVPLLGTFLVVLAGIVGFGETKTSLMGLITLALDTGGLPWFLIFTWQDTSFWDD